MDIFGLIGRHLGHSYSALFFNDKFKKEGVNAVYQLFPLPSLSDFQQWILTHPEIKGLNVTIPYKEEIIPYLTGVSPSAATIGAVNVIKCEGQKLIGHNTDWLGFTNALLPLLNYKVFKNRIEKIETHSSPRKALVLGSGGASRAVVFSLLNLGYTPVVVSRDSNREYFMDHTPIETTSYSHLSTSAISEAVIIVNSTPLGMWPDINSAPEINYSKITPGTICFDLVYNPEETLFMKKCIENGGIVSNGLEMLRLQAEEAWHIWNGSSHLHGG